jgi:Rieske Fe-S protein
MMTHDPGTGSELTRRAVVAGTGLLAVSAALAACTNQQQPAAAPGSEASSPASQPPPETSTTTAPTGQKLGSTADIPVGGGKVFAANKVVVTQPTAGTFKAFSAICTHQGCTVNKVADGTIDCPCHGSKYAVADGSVVHGPAQRPLGPREITVSGDEVLLQG